MRKFRKAVAAVTVCCLAVSLFTGCHGKKNNVSFVIPEEFDTDRNYEINFWAKSDTKYSIAVEHVVTGRNCFKIRVRRK